MMSFRNDLIRVLPLDVAGEYGSLVHGLGFTMITFGLVLNPIFMSLMISERNKASWSGYFFFLSLFNIWGAVIFFFYGSGRPEPWTEAGKRHQSYSGRRNCN